jgi:uncharacterized protein YkwD
MRGIPPRSLGILLALLACALLGPTASPATATRAAAATTDPAAASPGEPLGAPVAQACALNPQEQQLADLMRDHPEQKRIAFTCNAILARVARERAVDMVTRRYVDHVNPDGFGANYLVRQAGYVLPTWYGTGTRDQYIESITAGGPYTTAQAAFTSLLADPPHRRHILGEVPMYATQTDYGIGYTSGGQYGNYWVVLTAQPGP